MPQEYTLYNCVLYGKERFESVSNYASIFMRSWSIITTLFQHLVKPIIMYTSAL